MCPICLRQTRGFGWTDPKIGFPRIDKKTPKTKRKPVAFSRKYYWFCSTAHVKKWLEIREKMIDPTPFEIEGMKKSAQSGGEYLDSIGKTDLASLSYEEYMTFIEAVITTYVGHTDVIPF